jgi:hypothetical protein
VEFVHVQVIIKKRSFAGEEVARSLKIGIVLLRNEWIRQRLLANEKEGFFFTPAVICNSALRLSCLLIVSRKNGKKEWKNENGIPLK